MNGINTQASNQRIDELDFMKSVFILLMIAFHLVYIGNAYPYAKQLVYTFHMPGFLLISGYLFNISKQPKRLFTSLLWIFIPYAVMSTSYAVMASLLPIRDHIDHLTLWVLADKVMLHPIGPYWYLHTLIVCGATYYVIFHFIRLKTISQIFLFGLSFYFLSTYFHLISLSNAGYFMAGSIIRQTVGDIRKLSIGSWFSLIPLIILCLDPINLDKNKLSGIFIVFCVFSLLFCFFPLLKGDLRRLQLYIGRNTMPLLLFSPIFTIIAKIYQPYLLQVDSSGMIFLIISLIIAVLGSYSIVYLMDKLNLSRFFFGKPKELN